MLCFLQWLNWETYVSDAKFVFGDQKCFRPKAKTFLVSEQQNLFLQHVSPPRLNWETFPGGTPRNSR